ncbi:hypothetical protein [Streptomyces fungicidicus]|uniref:hypothetical protein n=1 Tax=Streptomyces fungicidicus TaxID=68203 RepID=UPI0036BAB158
MRWHGSERILLLSGDHGEALLSAHEAKAFVQEEYSRFDSGSLPYTWQLDRHGPGHDHGWTFNGHAPTAGHRPRSTWRRSSFLGRNTCPSRPPATG